MMSMLSMLTLVLAMVMMTCVARNEDLLDTVKTLAKQAMMQQLMFEEKIRTDGDSGIKQCRVYNGGTKPYHMPSYSSKIGAGACHDHSNHVRTIGMGEFVAVLNGVEFRTRHNDYQLRMPSTTSSEYHATEDISFPEVPPRVLAKKSVKGQIKEMRKYFKAFMADDMYKTNYRKYFKPVLCYLEGAWTTDSENNITEPYESDRNWLDAHSWKDLEQKIRFNAYTGHKSNQENYAFLPRKIIKLVNGSIPVTAQWNYRILCHPIKEYLIPSRLRMVDDLGTRMMFYRNTDQHAESRRARFQINTKDSPWYDFNEKMAQNRELLDDLMEQIPGKDNYGAYHEDNAYEHKAYKLKTNKVKNVGYYHRWYQSDERGPMGLLLRHRGFADKNVFMAKTKQPNVAPMEVEDCKGKGTTRVCKTYQQRWSYAIPLEIIYMTPLLKWNPYDIHYKGNASSPNGKSVEEGGKRNGGFTKTTAYNGTHHQLFYHTPAKFFKGRVPDKDKADTYKASVGVLDKNGIVRSMTSSGTRAILPYIPSVGMVRQRYPIMPLHNEGSPIWKELQALKDIVMDMRKYGYMMQKLPTGEKPYLHDFLDFEHQITKFILGDEFLYVDRHVHHFSLTEDDFASLRSGLPVDIITLEDDGHSHMVTLRASGRKRGSSINLFKCDGQDVCMDGHSRICMKRFSPNIVNISLERITKANVPLTVLY